MKYFSELPRGHRGYDMIWVDEWRRDKSSIKTVCSAMPGGESRSQRVTPSESTVARLFSRTMREISCDRSDLNPCVH